MLQLCIKSMAKSSAPWAAGRFCPRGMSGAAMKPADENDAPVFVGRFNIGAVSLHLPMILA